MPQRKTGHGAVFKIDDDNNSSYTEVAQVKSITPGSITVEKIEDTVLSDTRVHYSPAGLCEDTEYTIELVVDPNAATHAALRTVVEARTEFGAQIVLGMYSTSKTWQCTSGFVTEYTWGAIESKTVQMLTIKYQPNVLPTFT